MHNTLRTIDGETLMSRPLTPIPFVIRSLLPTGLHILAGAPKIGKSWLALWLCLQVAKGEPVWSFAAEKKEALYLCLEDSEARIQNRLFDITEDAPPTVYFSVAAGCIGDGLEAEIEQFVAVHPDTGLIVIDTLQKVRRVTNDNAYAGDYRDIGTLKSLADKLGVAILLIHHLRKLRDDDPMNMVSGTTGITGAVDSSFVLTKSRRSSDRATLICSGRDIEYRELQLAFDGETHVWSLISDSVEHPEDLLDDTVSLVCSYIREHGSFKGRPSALAEAIRQQTGTVIQPNMLSRRLNQHQDELRALGILYCTLRSNGDRIVELTRQGVDGVGNIGTENTDPTDPSSSQAPHLSLSP
ncbi:helicase RepA family protein [Oscillospiraceae bacterium OttesenSCG-928-G22]|nr:helicase RepA family protein [Oscillospiraceae bacterium OttesenSCG-928-G22]